MKVSEFTRKVVFHLVLCLKIMKLKYCVDCCAGNIIFNGREVVPLELVTDTTQDYNINLNTLNSAMFYCLTTNSTLLHV